VTIDVRSNDESDYGYLKMVGVGVEEQLDSQLEQLLTSFSMVEELR
jgi:hypothetical protein